MSVYCTDCTRDLRRGHLATCPQSRASARRCFIDDVTEMRAFGETPERAASRLGMTVDAMARRLRRYGMPWLAADALAMARACLTEALRPTPTRGPLDGQDPLIGES